MTCCNCSDFLLSSWNDVDISDNRPDRTLLPENIEWHFQSLWGEKESLFRSTRPPWVHSTSPSLWKTFLAAVHRDCLHALLNLFPPCAALPHLLSGFYEVILPPQTFYIANKLSLWNLLQSFHLITDCKFVMFGLLNPFLHLWELVPTFYEPPSPFLSALLSVLRRPGPNFYCPSELAALDNNKLYSIQIRKYPNYSWFDHYQKSIGFKTDPRYGSRDLHHWHCSVQATFSQWQNPMSSSGR